MSLVHRIDVVLVLLMSIVLVLENLGQNALCACRLTLVVHHVLISIALNAHSSTMNSVELILNASICTR